MIMKCDEKATIENCLDLKPILFSPLTRYDSLVLSVLVVWTSTSGLCVTSRCVSCSFVGVMWWLMLWFTAQKRAHRLPLDLLSYTVSPFIGSCLLRPNYSVTISLSEWVVTYRGYFLAPAGKSHKVTHPAWFLSSGYKNENNSKTILKGLNFHTSQRGITPALPLPVPACFYHLIIRNVTIATYWGVFELI